MPCVAAHTHSPWLRAKRFLSSLMTRRWPPVDQEGIASNGVTIFCHAAIGICIPNEGPVGLTIGQPEVSHPSEVAEDPLHSVSMHHPRVHREPGHS